MTWIDARITEYYFRLSGGKAAKNLSKPDPAIHVEFRLNFPSSDNYISGDFANDTGLYELNRKDEFGCFRSNRKMQCQTLAQLELILWINSWSPLIPLCHYFSSSTALICVNFHVQNDTALFVLIICGYCDVRSGCSNKQHTLHLSSCRAARHFPSYSFFASKPFASILNFVSEWNLWKVETTTWKAY